jgi:hypothetical protein
MDREQALTKAIEDLQTGVFTKIREAARENGVCRMTLKRQLNGAAKPHDAHESQQALTKGEELALVELIQRSDRQGFPIRHTMLKATAEYLIQKRFGDTRRRTLSIQLLSSSWTNHFIKWHPFLKTQVGKPLEQNRAKACTYENLINWFQVFRNTMDTYKPELSNIYNIDETGFQIGRTSRSYVTIGKRQRTSGHSASGSKGENISARNRLCRRNMFTAIYYL